MLKYRIEVLIRNLLKIFYILPVKKNQIFFEAFHGQQMNCNPKYIYEELQKSYPGYKIIWCYNKENHCKDFKTVKFHSFAWLIASLRSGVLVNNDSFGLWVPYRKKQLLINTWHGGGAYKRIGNSDNSFSKSLQEKLKNDYFVKVTDYFLSSSKIFTKNTAESYGFSQSQLIETGMPRNDIFFSNESVSAANDKVRQFYNFSKNDFIVLYAPTFRRTASQVDFVYTLNFNKLKESYSAKFNKNIVILYRGHHIIADTKVDGNYDIDVTAYPDMQELLCACDSLITDYSSSIWDYSFTQKPCFLFTPDIDFYIKDRGFYTDPSEWGFPYAKTNEELSAAILNFDSDDFKNKLQKNHALFGNVENGTASKQVAELINNFITGK